MKRIVCIILSVIFLTGAALSLFSCGGSPSGRIADGEYKNAVGSVVVIESDTLYIANGEGDERIRFAFGYTLAGGQITLEYRGYEYSGEELSADYIAELDTTYRTQGNIVSDFAVRDSDTFLFDGSYYTRAPLDSLSEWRGSGACEYADSRDAAGRDITYVEICFRYYGRVILALDATSAPVTVANFLSLVERGFYDGLTLYRTVEGYAVFGGDPNGNGTGGTEAEIVGEFSSNGYENDISHKRGVISMFRTGDYDSANTQFFICTENLSSLDGEYAAFGYVTAGMSVIDSIVSTTSAYTSSSGLIYYPELQPVIDYARVAE